MSTPLIEINEFQGKKRQHFFSHHGCIVIILLIACSFTFLGWAVRESSEAARRMQCVPKQLAIVLLTYHDTYKSFPPAYTTDADGKPLHSWRVLVLPFMEQQRLYEEIRLDEPWDSLHNSQFHGKMPRTYYCPSRPMEEQTTGLTPYQMIIGTDTISNGPNSIKLSDVTRGQSDTLLFVEASVSVPWMKPEDLPQSALQNGIVSSKPRRGQPVVQGIGSPHYNQKHIFGKKTVIANIAMVDTSCPSMTEEDVSPEELLEMSRIRKPE
jgi:hypothetical protein